MKVPVLSSAVPSVKILSARPAADKEPDSVPEDQFRAAEPQPAGPLPPEPSPHLKGILAWLENPTRAPAWQQMHFWNAEELTTPLAEDSQEFYAESRTTAVLNMLAEHMGPDTLKKELERILAGGERELSGFYEQLPAPYGQILKDYATQPGVPHVSTRIDGNKVKLSQEPWRLYPDSEVAKEGSAWHVPVILRYRDDEGVKTIKTVLPPEGETLELPCKGKIRWAYPNGGGQALFRTPNQPEIAGELEKNEQLAMLINQWRHVRHGTSPISAFYEMALATAKGATDDWVDVMLVELNVGAKRIGPQDQPAYARFTREMLDPILERWGTHPKEGEPNGRDKLRARLCDFLARAGNPAAQERVRELTEAYKAGKSDVYPTLLGSSNDPELFELHLSRLRNPKDDGETFLALAGLSSFESPQLLNRFLDEVLSSDRLREDQKQEALTSTMVNSRAGKDVVWQRVRQMDPGDPRAEAHLRHFALTYLRAEVEAIKGAEWTASHGGEWQTLADLPQQIAAFLDKREQPDWFVAQ